MNMAGKNKKGSLLMKTNSNNNGTPAKNNGAPKDYLSVRRTGQNNNFSLKFMEGKTVRAVAGIFGGSITIDGRPERCDHDTTDLPLFKRLIIQAHEQGLGVLMLK